MDYDELIEIMEDHMIKWFSNEGINIDYVYEYDPNYDDRYFC